MYLLDTNIIIFAINNKSDKLLNKINNNSRSGVYVSSLTVAELEFGVSNSNKIEQNRIALIKFLSLFNILDFTGKDAIPYGIIKSKLKRIGKLIGPIDMLLAAQAINNGMVMVTNNTREFMRIDGLTVEDWTK